MIERKANGRPTLATQTGPTLYFLRGPMPPYRPRLAFARLVNYDISLGFGSAVDRVRFALRLVTDYDSVGI